MEDNSTEAQETVSVQDSVWKKFEKVQNEKNSAPNPNSPIIYEESGTRNDSSLVLDSIDFHTFSRQLQFELEQRDKRNQMSETERLEELQKKGFVIDNNRFNTMRNIWMKNDQLHKENTDIHENGVKKLHKFWKNNENIPVKKINRPCLQTNNTENMSGSSWNVGKQPGASIPLNSEGGQKRGELATTTHQLLHKQKEKDNVNLDAESVESADLPNILEDNGAGKLTIHVMHDKGSCGKEIEHADFNVKNAYNLKPTTSFDAHGDCAGFIEGNREQQASYVSCENVPLPVCDNSDDISEEEKCLQTTNAASACNGRIVSAKKANEPRIMEITHSYVSKGEEHSTKIFPQNDPNLSISRSIKTGSRVSVAEKYRRHRDILSCSPSNEQPKCVQSLVFQNNCDGICMKKTPKRTSSSIVNFSPAPNEDNGKTRDESQARSKVIGIQSESVTKRCNSGDEKSTTIRFDRDQQKIASFVISATPDKTNEGREQTGKTEIRLAKNEKYEKQEDKTVLGMKEENSVRKLIERFGAQGSSGTNIDESAYERKSFACLKQMFEKPATTRKVVSKNNTPK